MYDKAAMPCPVLVPCIVQSVELLKELEEQASMHTGGTVRTLAMCLHTQVRASMHHAHV